MKKILTIAAVLLAGSLYAQTPPESKPYVFTEIKTLATTPVKNQARSGTCWSFSGVGQIESDLLRTGRGEVILSDMWIVRCTYMDKAEKYVRMHGTVNFDAGGNTHDIFNVIRKYGIVPESVYPGLNYGTDQHTHNEVNAVLKAYLEAVIKNPNRTLSTAWAAGFNGILDAYFGKMPETFTYQGKSYSPESFAADLGLNWDDYISLASFTHHPFYERFALEIPDNWAWGLSYNIPLDDLSKILKNSIEQGYTATWSSDVSESGFQYALGFAILPATSAKEISGSDQARWTGISDADLWEMNAKVTGMMPEKQVTQELRQLYFDNYQTTDDHGMVIVGTATDPDGNLFYKVKNSWGVSNLYDGYFYVSPAFILCKTTNLMVNKAAIPADIKAKLGIK
ncbi:MAG: C1 family peptidase [Rikenellaceae bacterium]|jgi:bleomycin hydrolase|nr:C1 family peptidase [Rikenellaceae bacterium]